MVYYYSLVYWVGMGILLGVIFPAISSPPDMP